MPRYIDADAFKAELRKKFIPSDTVSIGQIYDLLCTAPTVDLVPPPVKCGECTGWEKEGRKIHKCDICRMFGFTEDNFCSCGERKEQK